MEINPGGIINDFLGKSCVQFSIPVYQRNYEWPKDQCIKLFDDIIAAHQNNHDHFIGTMISAFLKNENKIDYYVIIDGQQRLTTIYVLIKALIDTEDDESEKKKLYTSLYNTDKYKDYTPDQSSKMKLKPVKSDNQQLLLLMSDRIDDMTKDSAIYQNYIRFCDLVKQAKAENNISSTDIYDGLNHLTCAVITLDPDDNPQEVFERINSTGIPLDLTDKIRNFVLMVDVNQDELYEDYWLPAEVAVTREKMSAFFLDFLNMQIDGFVREDDAYDIFKEIYSKGEYSSETMLKKILHYAEFYKAFLFGDKKYSDRINEFLADLQKLKQTTVFLFLFHVFDDLEDGLIDEDEVEKVLEFLRNYSIRRIICEVNSNSLRGLYKTLYSRVFSNKGNKDHYYDSIVSFFQQLTSKDAIPSDAQFMEALEKNNLYRKNALCKYLLTAIENQGKEKVTGNLSIEHIMPQNKNLSTSWQRMLGENWQYIQDTYLHTLGNLTLTGYNSELGDKPFLEKKKLVEDNSKAIVLYEDVKNKDVWNETTIQERAKRLSRIVLDIFPITLPEIKVSFSDPRYKEYSCDDPEMATYKKPSYFVLQGERVNCGQFSDMLKLVVLRLYERDKGIIVNMARENERPLEWSQNILFSFDSANVDNSVYKIPGTDIFENTGYSAAHIMYIIREMLDRYDIEHSDFTYSARSTRPKGKE